MSRMKKFLKWVLAPGFDGYKGPPGWEARLIHNFTEEHGMAQSCETFSGPLHLAIMDGDTAVADIRVPQSVILAYFRQALTNKKASDRDRLALEVEILKGAVAGLWPVPAELKRKHAVRK